MSKIRIFSLGGLNENGKNMYVVEVDKNIYVFVTSGGTGSEGSFKDLKDTYKNLNFISSKRFIGEESNEEYTNWIK